MMSLENKPIKERKLKSLSLFLFFFALAHERIFIKTHKIESRFVIEPENILSAGVCVHFSTRKFYWLGQ